jgi:hypothetical protein
MAWSDARKSHRLDRITARVLRSFSSSNFADRPKGWRQRFCSHEKRRTVVIVLLEMRAKDNIVDLGGREVVDGDLDVPHLGSVTLAWLLPIARTDPTINLPSFTITRGSMNQDHAPLSFRRTSDAAT